MNLDPSKIQEAMQQMGMDSEEIEAEEVVIRCGDRDLIVSHPQVQKIEMQGRETFQISGDVEERITGVTDEDVEIVMEQAGVDEERAREALKETGGDLAEAIMELEGA